MLDFLLVLLKNRWIIFKNVLIVAILSVIISLLIPKLYRSSAQLIPIQTESSAISSLLGGYSMNILGKDVLATESYRSILESQLLKDSLIIKFDLLNKYSVEFKESAYKILDERLEVEVEQELGLGFTPISSIYIHVIDESPENAMDMANFTLDFLNSTVKKLNKTYAQNKYHHIENRYKQNVEDLANAENLMKKFQEKNGIIEITEQLKAQVQAYAELEAMKEKLDIQLYALAEQIGTENLHYKKMISERSAIVEKLNELNYGASPQSTKSNIFKNMAETPALALEYYRLFREIEIQNKIFEMISIQYEQAKMQLTKEIPSFLILNRAQLPTYKYKPKRSLIVLAAVIFAFFISILYVLLVQFIAKERLKNSELYKKISEMNSIIKKDINKLLFYRKNK